MARRYREETGTSEDQIDIYFGWHEKILLKAMQVHYASLSIREVGEDHGHALRRRATGCLRAWEGPAGQLCCRRNEADRPGLRT